uniref:Elongator complex protein 4 n=1 Tax=Cafeteria roenbergensis TaxID=33653 RepID=A0A7S0JS52_CAFRO|mmetsp:Transcript_14655/g.55208  ORF Transcript_14655/g.55208 Transcript_14655/m.55208 type:complete len:417 (+) Transcript_14655:114-1364(+)
MAASRRPPGTRPWLSGGFALSSGCAALDQYLGGGVPLGSVVVLEEDAGGGGLARALASLFLAQAGPSQHRGFVAAHGRAALAGFLASVPRPAPRAAGPPSGAGPSHAAGGGGHLGSAWQYRDFVQRGGDRHAGDGGGTGSAAPVPSSGRSAFRGASDAAAGGAGADAVFCSAFDLDRPLGVAEAARRCNATLEVVACGGDESVSPALLAFAGDALSAEADASAADPIAAAARQRAPGRLVWLWGGVMSSWPGGAGGAAVRCKALAGLWRLRRRVKAAGDCVALVVVPPMHTARAEHGATAHDVACLLRCGDVVLRAAAFGQECGNGACLEAPQGFGAEYAGILRVGRAPLGPGLVPSAPRGGRGSRLLLVGRSKRRLTLDPMHLPPEGEDARPRDGQGSSGTKPSALAAAVESLAD